MTFHVGDRVKRPAWAIAPGFTGINNKQCLGIVKHVNGPVVHVQWDDRSRSVTTETNLTLVRSAHDHSRPAQS